MPEPTREGRRRIELFVREELPGPIRERRTELTAELEALVADGTVDSYSVGTWPKRRPIGRGDAAARYASFREWARAAGADLSPFFNTRTCYSPSTGRRGEWLVYPAMCLAVFDGDELAAVYPHRDADGRTHTVTDGVETLRDRSTPDDAPPLASGVAD